MSAATGSHLQTRAAEYEEVPSTDGGCSRPQNQHVLGIISPPETDRESVGATAEFNRAPRRLLASQREISDRHLGPGYRSFCPLWGLFVLLRFPLAPEGSGDYRLLAGGRGPTGG